MSKPRLASRVASAERGRGASIYLYLSIFGCTAESSTLVSGGFVGQQAFYHHTQQHSTGSRGLHYLSCGSFAASFYERQCQVPET